MENTESVKVSEVSSFRHVISVFANEDSIEEETSELARSYNTSPNIPQII